MKTLIFSDTHLTHRFDQRKYEYLKQLISSVDEVVINGDFWDGLSTNFDRFVNSEWKQLFPLLKSKNTVYVYGNHDFKYMSDERVNLFSTKQLEEHSVQTNPRRLIIKHGHQHTISLQNALKYPQVLWVTNTLYEIAERIVLWLIGTRIFKFGLYKKFTASMSHYAKHHLKDKEVLVCGHSHSACFLPDQKYINTGFIRHGLAQYLLIEDLKMKFIEEKY